MYFKSAVQNNDKLVWETDLYIVILRGTIVENHKNQDEPTGETKGYNWTKNFIFHGTSVAWLNKLRHSQVNDHLNSINVCLLESVNLTHKIHL